MNAPQLTMVSGVTGRTVSDEAATPAYWLELEGQTAVRFACHQALREVFGLNDHSTLRIIVHAA